MPISQAALEKEANRFIAVKGDATVGQAMAAYENLEAKPWWHLVVHMPNGSWCATRFRELSAVKDIAEIPDTPVSEIKSLIPSPAVERDSVETKDAQTQARKSPSRVCVVIAEGRCAGILVEGTVRSTGGMTLSAPDVTKMGGKYINLKDYGTILLGSSKK